MYITSAERKGRGDEVFENYMLSFYDTKMYSLFADKDDLPSS